MGYKWSWKHDKNNTLHRHGFKLCSASNFSMSKPGKSFLETIWMSQRRTGRWSCGQIKPKQNQKLTRHIYRVQNADFTHQCEDHALGLLFCKGVRVTDPYYGKNEWGHLWWNFGPKSPSISESIEDKTWLDLSAIQLSARLPEALTLFDTLF